MNSFYYYVDNEGKMPFISRKMVNSRTHKNCIQYANNKPVKLIGNRSVLCSDITGSKVWDYSKNEYVTPPQ